MIRLRQNAGFAAGLPVIEWPEVAE